MVNPLGSFQAYACTYLVISYCASSSMEPPFRPSRLFQTLDPVDCTVKRQSRAAPAPHTTSGTSEPPVEWTLQQCPALACQLPFVSDLASAGHNVRVHWYGLPNPALLQGSPHRSPRRKRSRCPELRNVENHPAAPALHVPRCSTSVLASPNLDMARFDGYCISSTDGRMKDEDHNIGTYTVSTVLGLSRVYTR